MSIKIIILVVVFSVCFEIICSVETNREIEGLPSGYLSECPGSTKKAVISRRNIKKLQLVHAQKGFFLTANRTFYNYLGMKTLAQNLDFSKKTVVFQSGYFDTSRFNYIAPALGELYGDLDYNVLLVEYQYFMIHPYPVAARLLRPVGQKIAEMLVELTKYGLDPKKVELLGVSHGGQGISYIAKSYRNLTGYERLKLQAPPGFDIRIQVPSNSTEVPTEFQRSVQGPSTHEFERLDYELERPIPEQPDKQDSSSSSSSSSESSETFYEGKTLSRMTGMDPSGPCFRTLSPEERFDASDADKVDVIHANGDGFGMMAALGDIDFYVNGGEYQLTDLMHFIPCEDFCSHIRALELWIAALLHPDIFIAVQCDNIQDARDNNCHKKPLVTNRLGLKADFNKTGIFYLATTNLFPYGVGRKGLIKGYSHWMNLVKEMNKDNEIVV